MNNQKEQSKHLQTGSIYITVTTEQAEGGYIDLSKGLEVGENNDLFYQGVRIGKCFDNKGYKKHMKERGKKKRIISLNESDSGTELSKN